MSTRFPPYSTLALVKQVDNDQTQCPIVFQESTSHTSAPDHVTDDRTDPEPITGAELQPGGRRRRDHIVVFLQGDSMYLTASELAALKVRILDKLQAEAGEELDRTKVTQPPDGRCRAVVGQTGVQVEAVFKPRSGVDIADAYAIAAAIDAGSGGMSHFVTPDAGATQCPVFGESSVSYASPTPTMAPRPSPALTVAPTEAPMGGLGFSHPTSAPATLTANCGTIAGPDAGPDIPPDVIFNFPRLLYSCTRRCRSTSRRCRCRC